MADQGQAPNPPPLDSAGVIAGLQAVDELFYVFTPTGELQYWNDALATVTGHSDAAIAAMAPTDFFVAADRDRIATAINRARDGEYVRVEADLQTEQDDRIPHEFSAVAFTHDATQVIAGIGRDITERKQREQDLLISEYTIDSALSGIAIATLDGELVSVNPSFLDLWGYETEDDVLGKSVTDVWKRPDEAAKAKRIVTETGYWNGDLLAVRQDGTTFHAQCSASTVTDHDGAPLALMSSFVDITARKERERELQQQTEQLEEFASVVSHDLRNPLTVAKGRLQLAKDEYDGDHLEPVETALDRMEAIIEDTLVLAQEGQTVGDPEPVPLHQITHQSWEMVDTPEATLEISDEFQVYADHDRLLRVFENLFRNAIEHGEAGTIRVGRLDDTGFYVEDDGPGIPESERSKVLDAGYTQSGEGTGFGLAIVNRVADAHGWKLSVTDANKGGARFEFTNVDQPESHRTANESSKR